MTSLATASSPSRVLHGVAEPFQGVPFEVEFETLTLLLLVITELLDVLLPVDSDRRLHRTVVRFQPSPEASSVTHAGSASPGLVCWGAAWGCGSGSAGVAGSICVGGAACGCGADGAAAGGSEEDCGALVASCLQRTTLRL